MAWPCVPPSVALDGVHDPLAVERGLGVHVRVVLEGTAGTERGDADQNPRPVFGDAALQRSTGVALRDESQMKKKSRKTHENASWSCGFTPEGSKGY